MAHEYQFLFFPLFLSPPFNLFSYKYPTLPLQESLPICKRTQPRPALHPHCTYLLSLLFQFLNRQVSLFLRLLTAKKKQKKKKPQKQRLNLRGLRKPGFCCFDDSCDSLWWFVPIIVLRFCVYLLQPMFYNYPYFFVLLFCFSFSLCCSLRFLRTIYLC